MTDRLDAIREQLPSPGRSRRLIVIGLVALIALGTGAGFVQQFGSSDAGGPAATPTPTQTPSATPGQTPTDTSPTGQSTDGGADDETGTATTPGPNTLTPGGGDPGDDTPSSTQSTEQPSTPTRTPTPGESSDDEDDSDDTFFEESSPEFDLDLEPDESGDDGDESDDGGLFGDLFEAGDEERGDGNASTGVDQPVPGGNWTASGVIENDGDVAGELNITNVSVVSYENGRTEPERAVDDTGGDPGRGAGELDEALQVKLLVVEDGEREPLFDDDSGYVPVESLEGREIDVTELGPGEEAELVVQYRLPASVGNEVQTDSVVVDFGFTLVEIA
ncbi:hypothetical protein RYH80_15605 [Halobaculum sp. MBLA0147]|uniref:hypothetical protein n=1 Tax=Halobaculum sp. MBLA0147 TaxID=3079934 RepID=UPI003523F903